MQDGVDREAEDPVRRWEREEGGREEGGGRKRWASGEKDDRERRGGGRESSDRKGESGREAEGLRGAVCQGEPE